MSMYLWSPAAVVFDYMSADPQDCRGQYNLNPAICEVITARYTSFSTSALLLFPGNSLPDLYIFVTARN